MGRGLGVGTNLGVGVGLGVAVAVAVAVAVGVGVAPPARLNAPILKRQFTLFVGRYSLMYQKVISSDGSICSDV